MDINMKNNINMIIVLVIIQVNID